MKSVLITGAAQGLGRALFQLYFQKGWKVFPLVRKQKDMDELKSLGDENCYPILADLRDEDIIEKITSVLEINTDTLDVLINNAGYVKKIEGILSMTGEDLDNHFLTNVTGAWQCARACYPFLKRNGQGIIINISSRRGTFEFNINEPYKRANAYKVTKCALNMLSVIMDEEFSKDNIRVLPVHPGALKTRVAPPDADTLPETAALKLYEWIQQINENTPVGLYDIINEKYLNW